MALGRYLGLAVLAGLVALILYVYRFEVGDLLAFHRRDITATVYLDNRCELRDSTLIVRDMATGAYAGFSRGVATLDTKERNRLRLELAPRYQDVEFLSVAYPARRSMTLIADCSPNPLIDLF
jgi:hypothetical protein